MTRFFHYTTRDAAFGHILPSKNLRLSAYDRMNDPIENQPWQFMGGSVVAESSVDPEPHQEAFWQFTADAHEIWESAKLLALTVDAPSSAGYEGSAEPFGQGWARGRMWDQYGERHMGVCLVFDQGKLIDNITSSLVGQGLAKPYHRCVEYSHQGPADPDRIPHIELNALTGNMAVAKVREFIEQHHDRLFFHKTLDWQTEFEYRFVVTAPDCEFVHVNFDGALEAVIVGHAFPTWQIAGAKQRCDDAKARLYRISWATMACPMLLPVDVAP